MIRCIADFILDSDLCLARGSQPLTLNLPSTKSQLRLSNATDDPKLADSVLSAQLTFEIDSLQGAREVALEELSGVLDYLSFVTNRKFAIKTLRRIVDWTPGVIDRNAVIYAEAGEWDLAEPGLSKEFLHTAERLQASQSGEAQLTALGWYRRAIRSERSDEQFSYFWFALEIAAEELKGKERVPSKCNHCGSPLFCNLCNKHPTHRRYRGDAIRQLIERVHPADSESVFDTLQLIRHTLLHGGRIASILDRLPCTEQQAVDKLAWVTRSAIFSMFPPLGTDSDAELTLGQVDSVARRRIIASARVTTPLVRGDPNDPKIEDFPNHHLEIEQSLKNPKTSP